ncbi:hypothetical protein ACWDSD_22430 [Streptomyces spiralis]
MAAIEDLTGWLVTTTSRIALDGLRSARARREAYVGPWLPEPVDRVPLDVRREQAVLVDMEGRP